MEQFKSQDHAHFCDACGNDVRCERDWCLGISPGEQSVECMDCYQKRMEEVYKTEREYKAAVKHSIELFESTKENPSAT